MAYAVAALLLVVGCTTTLYEPSYCSRRDTVAVLLEQTDTVAAITACVEWTAYGDSTMRWDTLGRRLP